MPTLFRIQKTLNDFLSRLLATNSAIRTRKALPIPDLVFPSRPTYQRFFFYFIFANLIVFLGAYYWALDTSRVHRDFYYLSLLLPFLLFLGWRRHFTTLFFSSKLTILATLLLVTGFLSAFQSPQETRVEAVYDGLRYSILILSFVALIVYLDATRPGALILTLKALVLSAAASALYFSLAYFQDVGGLEIAHRMNPGLTHANNPIPMAELYGMGTLLSIVFFFRSPRWGAGALWLLTAAATLLPIALSQSRGPILALVVAILAILLIRWSWKTITSIVVLGTIGAAAFLSMDIPYRDFTETRNVEVRMDIYQNTLRAARDNPIIGQGWQESLRIKDSEGRSRTHSHNTYLSMLYMGGAVGLALFLVTLCYAVYLAFQKALKHPEALIAFALLVFFSVISLTTTRWIHTSPDRGWLLFWLPLAAVIVLDIRQRLLSTPSKTLSRDRLHDTTDTPHLR